MTTATSNLEQAARTFIARRDRTAHPTGKFDNAGRWYPSESETCSCCSSVRSPSRSYPYSYMTHCRTMAHVANLYGVSVSELRKEVRRLDPDSAPDECSVVNQSPTKTRDGQPSPIYLGVKSHDKR